MRRRYHESDQVLAGNAVIGAQLLDPSQKEGFSMDAATPSHMKVTKCLPEMP